MVPTQTISITLYKNLYIEINVANVRLLDCHRLDSSLQILFTFWNVSIFMTYLRNH